MVGFCTSPRFYDHQTSPHHPERPDRLRAIFSAVREAGLIDSPNPLPPMEPFGIERQNGFKLKELEPTPADEKWLRTVHTQQHIDYVTHVCSLGGGVLDQGDTPVCPESAEIARLSVGAALRACDAVMKGETRRAFAAVRPPGHHAEPDRPMGFCLFSNIAIGARYVQQNFGVERIAIVDFDVHHGNGTQAAFEEDPSVQFISLHQHPRTCYPGTGYASEIGQGLGVGFTLNIPFRPHCDDADYAAAFEAQVIPTLDKFKPQVLMISAGFDAHRDDPLAQINLSDEAYEWMTRALVKVADQHCNGKVVSLLEGGYNLAALGRSVVRHLIGLQ
jgi:acetoin utilization deacetylase AcuC-like enzyme